MSYENERNAAGETETLSSDEQNVSRLLSHLKRVDPPKDFDFRLKARIANASPEQHRPVRLFPILKYALPLALFLMVGAAFMWSGALYNGSDIPAVAEVKSKAVPVSSPNGFELPPNDIETPPPVVDREPEMAAVLPKSDSADQGAKPSPATRSKGQNSVPTAGSQSSMDFGLNTAVKPRGPAKFDNSNSNSILPLQKPDVEVGISIPLQLRQVFFEIGLEVSQSEPKTWKVVGVKKDGIAERSGLKVGDLMEGIDGKAIDPLYKGSFAAKSISVRRDGKLVTIDIKN